MVNGDTIKLLSFINIISPGWNAEVVVLNIIDFSDHMAAIGVKHATYIAKKYLPCSLKPDTFKDTNIYVVLLCCY